MPAALKIKLRLEEDKRLLEISQSKETGKRVKQRAEAMRLSSHGWKVSQISEYFDWHEQTVREIIQRWKRDGEQGLYDLPKTGRPKQWQEEDLKYIETCLEKDGHALNATTPIQWDSSQSSLFNCFGCLILFISVGNSRPFPYPPLFFSNLLTRSLLSVTCLSC